MNAATSLTFLPKSFPCPLLTWESPLRPIHTHLVLRPIKFWMSHEAHSGLSPSHPVTSLGSQLAAPVPFHAWGGGQLVLMGAVDLSARLCKPL